MRIAFVTTQSLEQSTLLGRILPLSSAFQTQSHEVHVLGHHSDVSTPSGITFHIVGKNPFTKSSEGKKRQRGLKLFWTMLRNALVTTRTLRSINPEAVVIVKPLPQNVLGVWLWKIFNGNATIVLDVDDFELTANALHSIFQRAFIHWSERKGAAIANSVVTATPFLEDHFKQLTANSKPVHLLPTGLTFTYVRKEKEHRPTVTYIGSVSQSSGHKVDLLPEIIFQVQKTIPNVLLLIAGGGHDEHELKTKFESMNLSKHVEWHGRFNMNQVSDILNRTDVLIDPIDASITNRAKSSFRAALAIASGTPIVTSNIGIRTQLIPASLHNLFFATPANVASYAEKIVQLLQTPLTSVQQQEMVRQAQVYTWEELAKAYTKYIAA